MIALGFLVGFIAGVTFMGVVGYAYNKGRRSQLFDLVNDDDDLEWNHPELADLCRGKAPIRRMN